MLHDPHLTRIVEDVVKAGIAMPGLERVLAEPTIDSEGKEALRITVILRPDLAETLTGDVALDLLVSLQSALRHEGEERFPIIEYSTEAELIADDDDGPADEEVEDEDEV